MEERGAMQREYVNILMVDDDEDEYLFFTEGLEQLDLPHRIIFAKNSQELFNLLEKNMAFDIIFLDINLPVKDGKECLKEIKSHKKYCDTPVLMFTVSKNTSDIEEVFGAGAHYYAIKPYSKANYVETLKKIFCLNWKMKQPIPPKENFVINLAFA